jgi:hypothetical protein
MKLLRIFLGLSVAFALSNAAQAHRFAPSLLKVTETAGHQYNLVWKTPAQATSSIPLQPLWPENCEALKASPGQIEGTGKVYSWLLQCDGLGENGLVGEKFAVTGLGANQASAMLMIDLLDGRNYQQVLNGDRAEFVVPAEPGRGEVVKDYTGLGFEHIWGGFDHLLFVFGLLLLVGGGSRLVWTITSFTVGHSITLSLVTLGYFDYPVAWVEFAIAVSIFVLAVELTRSGKSDLLRRYPWWLAGIFGLLHGMGFAGALVETGLPYENLPLALLFFNVGIEIGQLSFIFGALLVWQVLKRVLGERPERMLPIPIYVLGSLSAMWCIERGLEALG